LKGGWDKKLNYFLLIPEWMILHKVVNCTLKKEGIIENKGMRKERKT
jgi:hypothetical protein